jgi:hypothetical protein
VAVVSAPWITDYVQNVVELVHSCRQLEPASYEFGVIFKSGPTRL